MPIIPQAEFERLLSAPMLDVTADSDPVVDIWPYVKSIPADNFHPHEIWDDCVECVYRTPDGLVDLVHVCTKTGNVFVVVVIDRPAAVICGHHLLNLNRLYGLE